MTPQNCISMDLKNLLSKWKLECLLSHLREQKIDADVLQMMKLPHIRLLLQNFPLGIQIRFEYNLEQWRKEIGKPFQTPTNENIFPSATSTECNCKAEIFRNNIQNKEIQTDLIIYNMNTLPQTNKEKSNNKVIQDPLGIRTTTSTTTPCDNLKSKLSNTFKCPRLLPKVDLRKILSHSSSGISLIKNFRFRKRLSNSERHLLISTIVNYYMENGIEFSVATSYAMERAILKMFHGEKLSFYRTTKRGRLYMKYMSAKAAAKKRERANYKAISNNMDYSVTDKEENKNLDQFPVDSRPKEQTVTTSLMPEVLHFEEDDNHSGVSDNNESMEDYIKIEPENFSETSSLDSMTLVRKMFSKKQLRSKEFERPFQNFTIPWHKVPYEVTALLENKQPLGKGLNVIANLIVDELRYISTQIPARILRTITQQAVMKYPHSFLENNEGDNMTSTTSVPLLSRLRNRNCNLNREKNPTRF